MQVKILVNKNWHFQLPVENSFPLYPQIDNSMNLSLLTDMTVCHGTSGTWRETKGTM